MTINVLYTINGKYKNLMLASCISMLINNSDKAFNIHIIVSDFTKFDYDFCENVLKDYKNVTWKFYQLESFDIRKYGIPDWRESQIANARLFFQEYIDLSGIDKLLYLDADTIVAGDLTNLINYNGILNASLDISLKRRLEKKGLSQYFNSGVLLFDIQKWVSEDLEKQIADFCFLHDISRFRLPDQDILNYGLTEYINKLPFRYNINPYAFLGKTTKFYFKEGKRAMSYKDITSDIENPIIYHLYGFSKVKPWTVNKTNPLNNVFDEYIKLVDKSFKKEELKGLWKLLAEYEILMYAALIIPDYLPEELVYKIKEQLNLLKKAPKSN